MAKNTVQSTNALYPEDEIVYIAPYSTSMTDDSLTSLTGASWTNIGAVTAFSREAAVETQQPPAQNVEHEQQISKNAENISVTIQELNMTNYNKLMGNTAQSLAVAGTSTSASDTYAAAALNSVKFEKFKNQSYTSTSASIPVTPTSIVVAGSSTYATPADYEVIQNENSEFGLLFTSTGSFSSTQSFTIAYDFTPKAQSILFHGGADELTPFMLKTYSLFADGRTLTSYYPRVEYQSGGAIADKDNASGEYKDMAFSLQAREHESYMYNSRKQFKVEVQTTA